MSEQGKKARTAVMWRLTDDPDPTTRWSYYTHLAPGPTAEDAMRAVVRDIKAWNEHYTGRGIREADPVPAVMWAIPFLPPEKATHFSCERHDVGEDFEGMFDYAGEVEVRL